MISTLSLEGTQFLQASAGTGKTHTLGLLVLRLVLEKKQLLRRLAVVTFTEAAARELSERIARFLRQAQSGQTDDPQIQALVAAAVARDGRDAVAALLDEAVDSVDQARITTIHGFCSRLLREFAFELRAGLGFERLPSEEALVAEILADFWRMRISQLDLSVQPEAADLDPAALAESLRPLRAFPELAVTGPVLSQTDAAEADAAWSDLRRHWENDKDALAQFLTSHPERFKKSTNLFLNPGKVFDAAEAELFSGVRTCVALKKLSQSGLLGALGGDFAKAGASSLPLLGFPPAMDDFAARFGTSDALIAPALVYEAWQFLQKELPRRKAKLRVRSDNDLILHVAQGLERGGATTVRAIRARFDAVLVDEFQDTDEVQNRIFQTLFTGAGTSDPTVNKVFFAMVGDPKQAIYAFRGGDVDSYLKAAEHLESAQKHTLDTNYRSEARLLDTLNRIYLRVQTTRQPFQTPAIRYEGVLPGRSRLDPLVIDGQPLAPVTLWVSASSGSPKIADTGRRVAAEIHRLRSTGQFKPADFAILVSSHDTGKDLRRELAREGILAVTGKTGSVLKAPEAREFLLLLEVMVHPTRLAGVKALLLSPLYGWDTERLALWTSDNPRVLATLREFRNLHDCWLRDGLAPAAGQFLRERGLWSVPGGDLRHQRRVANFRQLMELLHSEDLRLGRLPQRTLTLFRDWLAGGDEEQFEQVLEADEGAISIVTMHKAKGLQWPVVFAVDLYKDGTFPGRKIPPLLRDSHGRRCADFDPALKTTIGALEKTTNDQERQRLAYVTLTRAERLLYVVVRSPNHEAKPDAKPDQWLFRDQGALSDATGPLLALEPLEQEELFPRPAASSLPTPTRLPRKWLSVWPLVPAWSIGSYSALTRDLAKHTATPPGPPAQGIFAFPRGPEAGTALHTVFERIDFQKADDTKVRRLLTAGGIAEPDHQKSAVELVNTVLQAPVLTDDPTFHLAALNRADHAAEVEFHLSAAWPGTKPPLTARRLADALGSRVGKLVPEASLAGYLYGLMDLVFRWKNRWYVLDWKSNHLGNGPEDYRSEALQTAMENNQYLLQAHLYTVAWCRHLATVNPNFDYDTEFGGVIYLFLRGLDPEKTTRNGVYFLKPDRGDIETLGGLL